MCYPNEATQILTWKSMRIPGHWVRAKYYRKDFPMLITVNFPNAWIQAPNHAGFPLHGFPQGFRTHNCTGAGPSFSYLWFISYVCPFFGQKRQPCEKLQMPTDTLCISAASVQRYPECSGRRRQNREKVEINDIG